jgi:hypothetical protein
LTALYVRRRTEEEAASDLAHEAGIRLAAAEQLMWSAYEDANLTTLKLKDGSGARVQTVPYAVVRDSQALRQWAEANGFTAKLALPWGTVNSEVGERLLNGLPLPDGVEVYVKTTTVIIRG